MRWRMGLVHLVRANGHPALTAAPGSALAGAARYDPQCQGPLPCPATVRSRLVEDAPASLAGHDGLAAL